MGILDFLGLSGGQSGQGLLGGLFGPQQQQQPQYDWMPPPQQPGILGGLADNKFQMMGYLSGALMPGTTQERIARGLGGMTQGAQQDLLNAQRLDALKQHREQEGAAGALIDKQAMLTPEQKRFFATNPKAWEAYSNSMVSPTTTTVEGNILQSTPFGGLRFLGSAPQSERTTATDQGGNKVAAFAVKPNMANPQGGITIPGIQGLPQGNGAPPPGAAAAPAAPGAPPIGPGIQTNGGGIVTEQSPQRAAEQEGVGKGLASQYDDINKQALAASGMRTTFQRMAQLNKNPNMPQGQLAPMFQTFRSAIASFGGDQTKVAPGEEFKGLATQLTLDATGGSLGNQISNSDRDFIVGRMPSLSNTQQGRAEMLASLDLITQRKIDVAKQAAIYRRSHGNSLEGFQTHIADWAERNPLFANRPAMSATPGAPTPGAASAPPAALQALRANPRLSEDFDAKYGVGAAARALGVLR